MYRELLVIYFVKAINLVWLFERLSATLREFIQVRSGRYIAGWIAQIVSLV